MDQLEQWQAQQYHDADATFAIHVDAVYDFLEKHAPAQPPVTTQHLLWIFITGLGHHEFPTDAQLGSWVRAAAEAERRRNDILAAAADPGVPDPHRVGMLRNDHDR